MDTPLSQPRRCAKCDAVKPSSEFHRHRTGPGGLHSWCKTCANEAQKASREKHGRPPAKRAWNLSTRYGLTEAQVEAMRQQQGGTCAICQQPMRREVIDHCHQTGAVRGLLCHGCNIKLPAIEDDAFRAAALRYLGKL